MGKVTVEKVIGGFIITKENGERSVCVGSYDSTLGTAVAEAFRPQEKNDPNCDGEA